MTTLSQHSFFAQMPEGLRTKLELHTQAHHYTAGSVIFQRGDPGDSLLFIQQGTIEISLMSLNGRKSVLNHLNAGDVLGEIAVFDGEPRSADAYAKTSVNTLEIQSRSVKAIFEQNPQALWHIVQVLCTRVRNASVMFETRSVILADTRIARCLLKVAKLWGEQIGDALVIQQHLTQADLGDLSGLARENVNRHLKHFIEDDLIHYDKGRFTLLDLTRLQKLADQE